MDESMLIVVQVAQSKTTDEQHLWMNYSIDNRQHIPMMRLRPFQQDAQILYCIQQHNVKKLNTSMQQQNFRVMKTDRHMLLYACPRTQTEQYAFEYMLRTKAYIEVENLATKKNHVKVRHLLNMVVNKIKTVLRNLYDRQWITSFQYHQMDVQRSFVRLDYLFFTPNVSDHEQIVFQPFTISTLSPLMSTCRYLNRLLESHYYNQLARSTTIYKGADVIQALEKYQQYGYLKPTTLFVTLHIKDPHTSITHIQLLETLHYFLFDLNCGDHIQGMKLPAIIELTTLILQNQYFLYNHTVYQQISGGSTGLYLIDLLINIYLFYWQRPLIEQNEKYEIFGRRFNEIFFTWNQSKEKLYSIFNMMKTKHPMIQWDINIQSNEIHFLDAQIHHRNNRLHTHVYHDWKFEPYILPTVKNKPYYSSLRILRTALIRAILCCSQLQDFEDEQQYIESAFLFNRYSSYFIRQHVDEFFLFFKVLDLTIYPDQATYDELRQYVRQYDQRNIEVKLKGFEDAQKQCKWYIYTTLKGYQLMNAKRNPKQLLPDIFDDDDQKVEGMNIEIIGIPNYPPNTT